MRISDTFHFTFQPIDTTFIYHIDEVFTPPLIANIDIVGHQLSMIDGEEIVSDNTPLRHQINGRMNSRYSY
jgi:hypothetical protein